MIYVVEQVGPYAATVHSRLSAPDVELVASDLTRLECRVKPMKDSDAALLLDFDDFFDSASEIVHLSSEVMDRATEIRAEYAFRTPDSIHLAAAVVSGCNAFYTNDRRLGRFAGISIEVVEA